MKCPMCSGEMTSGSFIVNSDLWQKIIDGPARMTLRFRRADQGSGRGKTERVLEQNTPREGYRCLECGASIIAQPEKVNSRKKLPVEPFIGAGIGMFIGFIFSTFFGYTLLWMLGCGLIIAVIFMQSVEPGERD